MITYILSTLVIGFFVFELIEHVLFPLVWLFAGRKRSSICGNEGMPGKVVEVRSWQSGEGRVFVDGPMILSRGAPSRDYLTFQFRIECTLTAQRKGIRPSRVSTGDRDIAHGDGWGSRCRFYYALPGPL